MGCNGNAPSANEARKMFFFFVAFALYVMFGKAEEPWKERVIERDKVGRSVQGEWRYGVIMIKRGLDARGKSGSSKSIAER